MTSLPPDRRQLLSRVLRERGIRAEAEGPIPRRARSGPLPLSFNQERLWFLDRLHPGEANYNVPGIARLSGRLHLEALEQSLGEIVRRHESLRTTFPMLDGAPVQTISPPQPLKMRVEGLAHLSPSNREEETARLASKEARTPFNLAEGPLFRGVLLRLADEEHVLILNLHHIVADGWSIGILTRELGVLYEAFSEGKSSPLPEPLIQYADYTLWERERMRGKILEGHLSYWRPHLSGALPVLRLPTDRPRPSVRSYHGGHEPIRLPAPLSEAVRALAQREGVTPFMTLLPAFTTLLRYQAGQDEVVVGVPFANRARTVLEDVIGFFVNTLPIRVDLRGNPTFRQLLGRVREVVLGAAAHQELPLATLVRDLRLERELSRNPLFQVEFALLTPDHNPAIYGHGLRSAATSRLQLRGLTVTPLDVEGGVARFDLAIFLWDVPESLSGAVEYSTDLFDAPTIARIVDQFETALRFAVAEPEARLDALTERIHLADRQARRREERGVDDLIHKKLREVRRRSP